MRFILLLEVAFLVFYSTRISDQKIDSASIIAQSDRAPNSVAMLYFLQQMGMVPSSDNFVCAKNVFKEIIGFEKYESPEEVGQRNRGIEGFIWNFLTKNICFTQKALDFWHHYDSVRPGNFLDTNATNVARGTGWLWSRALKATGGNKFAAIHMATLCNMMNNQPMFEVAFTPEEQRKAREDFKQRTTLLEERLKTADSTNPESYYNQFASPEEKQRRIEEDKSELRYSYKYGPRISDISNIRCVEPYLPAVSLSSELDIPEDLKHEIARTQNRPLSLIYSKPYHSYISAFIGCHLAKCNIGELVAEEMGRTFGHGYRHYRTCLDLERRIPMVDFIERELKSDFNNKDMLLKDLLDQEKVQAVCKKPGLNQHAQSFCTQLASAHNLPDENARVNRILALLELLDASMLYQKWYLKSSLFNMNICLGIRTEGPFNIDKPESPSAKNNLCGIKEWDKDRCQRARNRLRSWDVDVEWSSEQNGRGARWGYRQCLGQPAQLDPYMCYVVEK